MRSMSPRGTVGEFTLAIRAYRRQWVADYLHDVLLRDLMEDCVRFQILVSDYVQSDLLGWFARLSRDLSHRLVLEHLIGFGPEADDIDVLPARLCYSVLPVV